ncbi:hypothetical protein [Motiliproteus sp. SC1-56]|uniref:hypothetical protein n=1 Tax=Motiliproteus sp. SC1-56 TaxID=2799565 RepID=UPI001A8F8CB6|nr:hypothetical protein [Motiliproteus sp. SC1-56]
MEEQIIDLPAPGSFTLYARIKSTCKYAYQNPRDGRPFEVKLDASGLWQGNDNQYAIHHLEFSWWCGQIGEYLPVNLMRGDAHAI